MEGNSRDVSYYYLIIIIIIYMSNTTSNTSDAFGSEAGGSDGMDSLYGLSYCLNFCWGTMSCILVALFATLLTGG